MSMKLLASPVLPHSYSLSVLVHCPETQNDLHCAVNLCQYAELVPVGHLYVCLSSSAAASQFLEAVRTISMQPYELLFLYLAW